MNLKQNLVKFFSSLLLVLTAMIWGVAFVAQRTGGSNVGPFAFNAARFIIGGGVMIPVSLWRQKHHPTDSNPLFHSPKTLFLGGLLCGFALFLASSFQQAGIIMLTGSVGKAGFITALYIVLVPIFSVIVFRKIPSLLIWISVVLACAGMYLLCVTEELTFATSDIVLFFCSVFYSIHILIIDRFNKKVDGIQFSCIQLLSCGFFSLIAAMFTRLPTKEEIIAAGIAILYAGICSSAIGYTLQIIGQKNLSSPVASLIMSLESVFSALAGWLLLSQTLSVRELSGCAIMFAAVVLTQLPIDNDILKQWFQRRNN